MKQTGYFKYGASDNYDEVLLLELGTLRRANESRWFWLSAEFVVDRICKSRNNQSVTLYYVRRPRKPKDKAVVLQSNWNGMQYFEVRGK